MFESILKIGESIKGEFSEEFPIERVKREGLAVRVIFDLNSHQLDIDILELKGERVEEIAREFLWVGNARGNTPQLRLTTDNYEYLLEPKKSHKWAISAFSKYIEDNKLFRDDDIRKLHACLKEIKDKFISQDLVKEFEEVLNREGIKKGEVGLYTVSVRKNDKEVDLAKEIGYKKLLRRILFENVRTKKGKCHVCGKDTSVLPNPDYPKGTLLSIYVVDKKGFASNVSGDENSLLKTHSVCTECKEKLMSGMKAIERYLSATIGDLNVLLIPSGFDRFDQNLAEFCKDIFETANEGPRKGHLWIEKVEKDLEDEIKRWGTTISINLVFGQPQQSRFIYYGSVRDVPPLMFAQIGKISKDLAETCSKHFNEQNDKWFIGLEETSRIIPLRKIKRNIAWKPLIELINSMLTKAFYPKDQILKFTLLYAKVHRFGNYEGYNIREVERNKRDEVMCRGLLKYNLLLGLLSRLEVIELEEVKTLNLEGVDGEIVKFCNEQGYTEWQAGLFLLGVLIGRIGIEQYKKGDEKKSILEKIDFNGTGVEKVKWLTNVVLEGLRNYRILKTNEAIYAHAKLIIDRNLANLRDPIANTFYILSGYSYTTLKAIVGGGENE